LRFETPYSSGTQHCYRVFAVVGIAAAAAAAAVAAAAAAAKVMSLIYTTDGGNSGGKRNRLYIGGKADAKDRNKLQQWGVTHVLNVTPSKEGSVHVVSSGVPNYFEREKIFHYKRVPVYDASTSGYELLSSADAIADFIARGLHHGSVLVHCNKGRLHTHTRSTTTTTTTTATTKRGEAGRI